MTIVCGIDTGGTFTDCVLITDEEVRPAKVPSTPGDFTKGVQDALRKLAADRGESVEELVSSIDYFFHGTTIATNIMVQRNGATAGILTTAGFRDIIFIQRGIGRVTGVPPQDITRISATSKPEPILPKHMIGEVVERIDCRGDVVVGFDDDSCRAAVRALLDQGVEAIGICFLWSFRNPEHERRAEQIVRELAPEVLVTRSSELAPKWGEYERTATVAINAYVAPATQRYLEALERSLIDLGLRRPMLVMTAPGGVVTAADAAAKAITTIGSGPTGGVIGASALAKRAGWKNVIATDMGGTSFEVAMIVDGEPARLQTSVIDKYEYFSPSVAVQSIGTGGGSIAWLDGNGRLRVGPQSAGAAPGPACYARGGTEPTVTDAELILGYLSDASPLAGTLRLHRDAAEQALRKIADPLGMTVQEAASGITRICEFAMADLIRKHTVQQGRDPRDFVLLAYGGAGAAHAGVFGAELGISEVVVPVGDLASLWSAFGVAAANVLHVLERTELIGEPLPIARLRDGFAELEHEARGQLAADGIADEAMSFTRSVDMRHQTQVHVVSVDVLDDDLAGGDGAVLVERFRARYESLYGAGAALPNAGVEILTLRLHARGQVGHRDPFGAVGRDRDEKLVAVGERPAFWPVLGEAVATPVYRGARFSSGERLTGPAIVELPNTTVVVQPGHGLRVDDLGNLVMTIPPRDVADTRTELASIVASTSAAED